MKSIKPLEDLIVAILLSEWDIQQCREGRCLHFKLERRKQTILEDYVHRFKLKENVVFDSHTSKGYIKPSIMLERVLKSWVEDNEVQAIEPRNLRLNMYLMWIALFGIKFTDRVVIQSSLGFNQQQTLSVLFNDEFQSMLIPGKMIQIKPFRFILLRALVQASRPTDECIELSYLLPEKEKISFQQSIIDWEEEHSTYVY